MLTGSKYVERPTYLPNKTEIRTKQYVVPYCYSHTCDMQMRTPEMQNLIGNPRAMEAMMQIQQGMQQLQHEAPGLMGSTG